MKHAKVYFSSLIKKFVMQDYDSKFGTLKVIQKPVKIEPEKDTFIQVGRTFLQFKLGQEKSERKSICAKLCGRVSRKIMKTDSVTDDLLARTINPNIPVKNEC